MSAKPDTVNSFSVFPRKRRPAPSRGGRRFARLGDGIFHVLCQGAALSVVALAALLTAVLVWKSWLAIRTIGIDFLTDSTWDPEPQHRHFGALAFIYGTVATSVIAMLLAVPFGVGTAVDLSEGAGGWVQRVCSSLGEMLRERSSISS